MAVLVLVFIFILFPVIAVICIIYDGKRKKYSSFKILIEAFGGLLFFVAFYTIGWYFFIYSFVSAQRINNQIDKIFDEKYAFVIFEGEIHGINVVKRNGREHGILCIDVTKTNTSSFYRFDKYIGLQIKDGMATVPIGEIGKGSAEHLKKYSFVKINEKNNKMIVFYNKNGDSDTLTLDYYHGGISERKFIDICKCNDSVIKNSRHQQKSAIFAK